MKRNLGKLHSADSRARDGTGQGLQKWDYGSATIIEMEKEMGETKVDGES